MNSPDTTAARSPGRRRPVVRVVRWPLPPAVEPTSSAAPLPDRVGLLCWLVVVLAGYYLVGLGVTLPVMVRTEALGLTPTGATIAATGSLVGMAAGTVLLAPWGRRLGPRRALLLALATASLSQLLVPLDLGGTAFAMLRLVGGLGLGLGLPALIGVVAPGRLPGRVPGAGRRRPHRVRAGLWLASGYHLGAGLAALLGLWLLPRWALLHVAGGAIGVVLLLLLLRALPADEPHPAPVRPESVDPTPSIRVLAGWRHRWVGVATVVASFMALLLVHGLNTWLPTLMGLSGRDQSGSLGLLAVLNVGALIGLAASSRVSARLGSRPAVLLWFGLAALGLAVLSVPAVPVPVLAVVVLLTGAVVASTQILIHGYVATVVPPDTQGAASGLVVGLGRVGAVVGTLVTGLMVAAGSGDPWAFQLFAGTALLGLLVLVVMTPRTVELGAVPASTERGPDHR